jgi:hypothetical protein
VVRSTKDDSFSIYEAVKVAAIDPFGSNTIRSDDQIVSQFKVSRVNIGGKVGHDVSVKSSPS